MNMRRLLSFVIAALVSGVPAAAPVTFGERLNAKFHHERCLSCHQFNSRAVPGRGFTSHRNRYLCKQCHVPERIGLPAGSEWMAPDKMDYTGFSAAATCRLVKQRMGNDPRGEKLIDHLLHDGRIVWALDSGMTPAGKTPTVPGGYAEWKRDVEAWVKDGMRCD
jgi:hypothetical protein